MPTATYAVALSVGGVSINKQVSRTASHPNPYEETLPAAKSGTLSTRTDDDTGVVTCPAHGLQVGDAVDIYWTGGGLRYGMIVSAVGDANTFTVGTLAGEVGAGDNFPAQDTVVQVCKQVSINTAIDGDAVKILGICLEYTDSNSTSVGHVNMQDVGAASIEAIDLAANVPQIWDVEGGAANPFTGNPITVTKASHNDTTNPAVLKIASLEEA